MSEVHSPFPGSLGDHDASSENTKSLKLSILQRFRTKRTHNTSHGSSSPERRLSESHTPSTPIGLSCLSRPPSISGVHENMPDSVILEEFEALEHAVVTHVRDYYTSASRKQVDAASRYVIEHATMGLPVPWNKIRSLLDDDGLRSGALVLCTSWAILSRSLLLKLGMSNSPGSTFLPPEIVECFQSFFMGTEEVDSPAADTEKTHSNYALLSSWKQISATLMHATYVKDAFSHFDSRTANVERALNDLDPLLRCYALRNDATGNYARLVNLREVLRQGARFAFTLFSQSCFWKFDWTIGPPSPAGPSLESPNGPQDKTGVHTRPADGHGFLLDMAVWPSLMRVMDGEGRKVEGDVLGGKRFVSDFA